MHREPEVESKELFKKIREISNPSKFRILELLQKENLTITELSKKANLAFNKCSNYCSELAEENLVTKEREGKSTLIKSNLDMGQLSKIL